MLTGRFQGAREAKEFLISRIVEEANRENAPLSEIERKMLYFSETDWTLPDIMQVNEEFDREYDQDDYEKRIKNLIIAAAKHDRKESSDQYDSWLEAIRILEKEDHYIVVMAQAAGLRPRGDQLRLFIAGIGIAIVVLSYVAVSSLISDKYGATFGKHLPPGTERIFFYSIVGLGALVAYRLGWITR
jgi:hypothetical protein